MISIIIPTYNEADQIALTINSIKQTKGDASIEIIVSDGGSIDNTIPIAKENGATVILSDRKGRAAQMNAGASQAKGTLFYFLHADSILPNNFTDYIFDVIHNGAIAGCFRLRFDVAHWFLKANCWFTRFNINAVRFGDQSLFVTKDVWQKCGGFKEHLVVMEDQEIIHRIKRFGKFKVMPGAVTTSARKYRDNGIYRMQGIFFIIWSLYYLGFTQASLLRVYKKLIRKHKL